ncbi:hypothetical protein IFT84_10330 [Rhizobium sp. CFBP 8762]|uniref:hypothetical protein n=1 Tax=Rhizobium sp. CFBP 8762 TaxID=2775279 RepID=UPI0017831085|nr:hypothetical protein [Rhizobium sp. CFBP 8762]MBD8554920.1 hypothetical protein [Rhizobium sp. CFBP 8762]
MASRTTTYSLDIDLDAEPDTSAVLADTIVVEDGPLPGVAKADTDIVNEDIDALDKLPDHAVRNLDGSVTLPLRFPVTIKSQKGGKITERRFEHLVFHRLVGADQRAIAAVADEHMAPVSFARSTRLNQAIMNALFDRMDVADIASGGQVLNHFLTNGPTTGR